MKKIPEFKTEKDEREFWASTDATRYIDWKKAKIVLPNLKPTGKASSKEKKN